MNVCVCVYVITHQRPHKQIILDFLLFFHPNLSSADVEALGASHPPPPQLTPFF